MYEGLSKNNVILFRTGMITNTGTCIIHPNKAGPLWIPFLLLHIVTVSLNSNVPPLNESMYPYPVKFCWLFFEPFLHYRFHFLITGIMFTSQTLFHGTKERQILFQWQEVKSVVKKWLKEQSTEFYSAGIHALIRSWIIAIERNGDCGEVGM